MTGPSQPALYPAIEPYETGRLAVGDGHDIYWERSGAPGARTVLFLHGGPGSGADPIHRRYFDPTAWDIILFDQRGCGRSRPLFALEANTTAHLLGDIEAVRSHLGVERWALFGPSWGSTLALAYAIGHPHRVSAMCLEGVFLGGAQDIAWIVSPAGAGAIHPEALERLLGLAPRAAQTDPSAFIPWALAAMKGEIAAGAAALDALGAPEADQAALETSILYQWSAYEETISQMTATPAGVRQTLTAKGRDWIIAHSLLEAHYFAHACFLRPGALMDGARALAMPVHLIQSRYDLVCPLRAAEALAHAIPQARLSVVPAHGHAMTAPVQRRVRAVFDEWARERAP